MGQEFALQSIDHSIGVKKLWGNQLSPPSVNYDVPLNVFPSSNISHGGYTSYDYSMQAFSGLSGIGSSNPYASSGYDAYSMPAFGSIGGGSNSYSSASDAVSQLQALLDRINSQGYSQQSIPVAGTNYANAPTDAATPPITPVTGSVATTPSPQAVTREKTGQEVALRLILNHKNNTLTQANFKQDDIFPGAISATQIIPNLKITKKFLIMPNGTIVEFTIDPRKKSNWTGPKEFSAKIIKPDLKITILNDSDHDDFYSSVYEELGILEKDPSAERSKPRASAGMFSMG